MPSQRKQRKHASSTPYIQPLSFEVPPVSSYPSVDEFKADTKRSWERDLEKGKKIRRPPNAFLLAGQSWRKGKSTKQGEFSRLLATAWNSLDEGDEVKVFFHNLSKEIAAMHKDMFPTYKYRPVRKNLKKHSEQNKEQEGYGSKIQSSRASRSHSAMVSPLFLPSMPIAGPFYLPAAMTGTTQTTGHYQQYPTLPAPFNPSREANVVATGPLYGMQHVRAAYGLLDFSGLVMGQASSGGEHPYDNFAAGAARPESVHGTGQPLPQNVGAMVWGHNNARHPISQPLGHDNFNVVPAANSNSIVAPGNSYVFSGQQTPEQRTGTANFELQPTSTDGALRLPPRPIASACASEKPGTTPSPPSSPTNAAD